MKTEEEIKEEIHRLKNTFENPRNIIALEQHTLDIARYSIKYLEWVIE